MLLVSNDIHCINLRISFIQFIARIDNCKETKANTPVNKFEVHRLQKPNWLDNLTDTSIPGRGQVSLTNAARLSIFISNISMATESQQ